MTQLPHRLRKRADFLYVQTGRRCSGPFFTIEAKQRKTRPPNDKITGNKATGNAVLSPANSLNISASKAFLGARIGYTVTRKQGNAVKRNRIKRRLREAVRTQIGNDFESGVDYVIIGRASIAHLSFFRLVKELRLRIRRIQSEISARQ